MKRSEYIATDSLTPDGFLMTCCIPAIPKKSPPMNATGIHHCVINKEITPANPILILECPNSLTKKLLSLSSTFITCFTVKEGVITCLIPAVNKRIPIPQNTNHLPIIFNTSELCVNTIFNKIDMIGNMSINKSTEYK